MTNEQLIQTAKQATRNDTVLQKGIIDLLCRALASMQSERDQLAVQLKQSNIDAACYKYGMDASNKLLADVAAENAVLKSYASDCVSAVEHWNSWADAEDKISTTPETPATDASLAEVRAQGVEQLASLAGNECQRYKSVNDRAGARKWKSIVILCTDFAAQLRNEVKV